MFKDNKRYFGTIVVLMAAAAVTVGTLPLASPAAAHNAPRRCGHSAGPGAGWYKVRAHGPVGCEKARRVARRWENKCISGTGCPRHRATHINLEPGYRCRYRQAGYESVRVKCAAENSRIVHFLWGS